MNILEVHGIKKAFGPTKVLNGIDFTLEKGGVLSVIGSSGSGKTTLLRCLNFLETPDAGTISVNGETLFNAAETGNFTETELRKKRQHSGNETELRKKRLHFGLVFQNFNLFPQYTAKQNVSLAMELLARERMDYKQNKNEIRAQIESNAERLLDEVGLSDRMGHYPHQLSGGQQQRVAIARALALGPDILCFDEPTSALDPEITGEVLNVISGLAKLGTTMIIVTHEMSFAREVSSKVIFLADGTVMEEGGPEEVFGSPKTERLRSFLSAVRT